MAINSGREFGGRRGRVGVERKTARDDAPATSPGGRGWGSFLETMHEAKLWGFGCRGGWGQCVWLGGRAGGREVG